MKKKTILDFKKMKQDKKPITWITAYDYPTAYCAEQAEIDLILVGDSGGMVVLGYNTTNPVTMNEMISFSKAVRKGAPNTFIVGDMPQGSYEISTEKAIKNALRFIKEADCDAIKCEGGIRVADKVQAMVNAGIPVIGHLGLTPQSTGTFGGYKVQAKSIESFINIKKDAVALANAGIFMLLLEAMPAVPSYYILKCISNVITMSIGAGGLVDGQLIIMHDLLGFYNKFRPHFAKCFVPDVLQNFVDSITNQDLIALGKDTREDGFSMLAILAIKKYINDVQTRIFPGDKYTYPISDENLQFIKSHMKATECIK